MYLHSNSILNTSSMFFQWIDSYFSHSKEKQPLWQRHLSGLTALHSTRSGGVQIHLVQITDVHVRVGFSCGDIRLWFFSLQEVTQTEKKRKSKKIWIFNNSNIWVPSLGIGSSVCRSVVFVKIILQSFH